MNRTIIEIYLSDVKFPLTIAGLNIRRKDLSRLFKLSDEIAIIKTKKDLVLFKPENLIAIKATDMAEPPIEDGEEDVVEIKDNGDEIIL